MSKLDANLFKILIREVAQDLFIEGVLLEHARVLAEAKGVEPLLYVIHGR